MAHILIRHRVNDYAAWKSAFDEFIGFRRSGGEKTYRIYHPEDDPNNLILLFEWDSIDNARTFLGSQELKETMQQAGVAEAPEISFLHEADRGTV